MGERLLVSFCSAGADEPWPSCLLLLDGMDGGEEWLDIGCADREVVSGNGLCADERFVFHISIVRPGITTVLSVLDRTSLEVVHVQILEGVSDGHSVCRTEEGLLVVSTGSDEVIAYDLHGPVPVRARTFWTPTGSGQDTHHLNSVTASADGRVACTAFGPKAGESWASASEGYVYDIGAGQMVMTGLRQPHSVVWRSDHPWFCHSVMGTVESPAGVVAALPGYTRGLAFGAHGSHRPGLLVATSIGRRRGPSADSDGEFLNPHDAGTHHGRCALYQLPPPTAAVSPSDGPVATSGVAAVGLNDPPGPTGSSDLGHAGAEIYDVLPLGPGTRPPRPPSSPASAGQAVVFHGARSRIRKVDEARGRVLIHNGPERLPMWVPSGLLSGRPPAPDGTSLPSRAWAGGGVGLWVVDGIFTDPGSIREVALAQDYITDPDEPGRLRTAERYLWPGFREELERLLGRAVSGWLDGGPNGVFERAAPAADASTPQPTDYRRGGHAFIGWVGLDPDPPPGAALEIRRPAAPAARSAPPDRLAAAFNRLLVWDAALDYRVTPPAVAQLFFFD